MEMLLNISPEFCKPFDHYFMYWQELKLSLLFLSLSIPLPFFLTLAFFGIEACTHRSSSKVKGATPYTS